MTSIYRDKFSSGVFCLFERGWFDPSLQNIWLPAFPHGILHFTTRKTPNRNCLALRNLNALGAEGYHWRVRIDEKPHTSHSSSAVPYSWWDVQDENARLPVKDATPSELKRMFAPPKKDEGDVVTQEVTKAAKGAMKYVGKAMNAVSDDDSHAVRTPVVCFKLLDLVKMRREFHGGGGGFGRATTSRAAHRAVASSSSTPTSARPAAAPPQRQRVSAPPPRASAPPARAPPPTADLMGFGAPSPTTHNPTPTHTHTRMLHHSSSMPATKSSTPTGALPNESRAEKLKREYAQKAASSNRVWDDVDQRWVDASVDDGASSSTSSSSVAETTTTASSSLKGISLSTANAAGKSASVQAAVHARVADMRESQQKAIHELREREIKKQTADAEEEIVRQRLEPKLKAWSEEHGKKKQLRALLANLHTILWEGSGWKPVSLADVLDDGKVKKVYHKASRVVHPDKTGHLDAEKRFIAKRVFDALTQAKVDFDEGKA
ncbi:hypothetical protein ACHAXS_008021 [Conticribra weissflogii]